jgi:hypothetical protein
VTSLGGSSIRTVWHNDQQGHKEYGYAQLPSRWTIRRNGNVSGRSVHGSLALPVVLQQLAAVDLSWNDTKLTLVNVAVLSSSNNDIKQMEVSMRRAMFRNYRHLSFSG